MRIVVVLMGKYNIYLTVQLFSRHYLLKVRNLFLTLHKHTSIKNVIKQNSNKTTYKTLNILNSILMFFFFILRI